MKHQFMVQFQPAVTGEQWQIKDEFIYLLQLLFLQIHSRPSR